MLKNQNLRLFIRPLILFSSCFALMVLVAPQTHAASILTATKTDVAASTIFTTFGDTPVYRLVITESGDIDGTVNTLAPTPSGTLTDTGVTLHFWLDNDQDGIVSDGDVDLGADAVFATNDTKKTFDIDNVTVATGTAEHILITASGTGVTTNTFKLSFVAAGDIAVVDGDSTCAGSFALANANNITVSSTAPTLDVSTGSGASDVVTARSNSGDHVLMDLVFATGATTGSTVKTISINPNSSTLNDVSNITAVSFYYDADSDDVAAAAELLTSTPTTFSADDTETVFTITGQLPIANGASKSVLVAFTFDGGATGLFAPQLANRATDVVWGSATADSDTSALADAQLLAVSNVSNSAVPAVAPTNVSINQNSIGQAKITWTDPPTAGYSGMQILRGKGWLPVNGIAYDSVGKGVEAYTDRDTTFGDTAKYILRPLSGSDTFGEMTQELSITITAATPSHAAATPASSHVSNRYTEAGTSETDVDSAVSSFSDLTKGAWHAPFISRMKKLGVITGYLDGTVQPNRVINRAELAKIATKVFKLTTVATGSFTDVSSSDWFTPFVGALEKVGATWTSAENYRPSENVSRGEALWVLLRAAGIDVNGVPTEKMFPDVNRKHRFAAAITYAASKGIVNGYENGNFGPGDAFTRAQIAKVATLIFDD